MLCDECDKDDTAELKVQTGLTGVMHIKAQNVCLHAYVYGN